RAHPRRSEVRQVPCPREPVREAARFPCTAWILPERFEVKVPCRGVQSTAYAHRLPLLSGLSVRRRRRAVRICFDWETTSSPSAADHRTAGRARFHGHATVVALLSDRRWPYECGQ